jgi:hypothetical protein
MRILLRAADRYAYRLWKHCLFCRDCLEGRDIYILLAFALLCWRRPVSPHRRSPCRFTGDHPVDHAQLVRLSPERGLFATAFKRQWSVNSVIWRPAPEGRVTCLAEKAISLEKPPVLKATKISQATVGRGCSCLSSNRLLMPIPFASERSLILFVVRFAFVFENDDEEENVSFYMSCPRHIPRSDCVSCSECCLSVGSFLLTVGFGSSE